VLQLHQFQRRVFNEMFHDILVAEPVATAHRVVEVHLQGVVGSLDARGTTLGGTGVAAHRVDLRNEGDLQLRVGFCNRDRRTQAGAAGPDNDNISLDAFHIQNR
jgi:hypothetical protein